MILMTPVATRMLALLMISLSLPIIFSFMHHLKLFVTLLFHHFVHNPEVGFIPVQTEAQTSSHLLQIPSKPLFVKYILWDISLLDSDSLERQEGMTYSKGPNRSRALIHGALHLLKRSNLEH